jgi:beta-glucanase (GH16 family)
MMRNVGLISFSIAIVLLSFLGTQAISEQSLAPIQSKISDIDSTQGVQRLYNLPIHKLRNQSINISYTIKKNNISTTVLQTPSGIPPGNPSDWTLTFADEFTGTEIVHNKWATEYGFNTDCIVDNPPPEGVTSYCNRSNNNEKEWYVDDGQQVSNGILHLVAKKNDCSGDNLPDRSYPPYSCANFPYLSGMVSTHSGFSQLYGYFEARIKIPKGQGLWPAFWLLPQLPPSSSPAELFWPPEIDIMENKGQDVNNIYMTHLFSGVYPDPGSKSNNWSYGGLDVSVFTGPDFSNDFHIFAVEWEPDVIVWYIDGVEQFRSTLRLPPGNISLPDYPGNMHIIFDLAVGGDFVDNLLPDDSDLPASLDIDYVRVYQRIPNEASFPAFLPFITNP